MVFDSSDSLRCRYVSEGDEVIFNVKGETFKYEVTKSYLNLCGVGENSVIFDRLGIVDKEGFCSCLYGYISPGGSFPCFKKGDYKALERLLKELFTICRHVNDGFHISSDEYKSPKINFFGDRQGYRQAYRDRQEYERAYLQFPTRESTNKKPTKGETHDTEKDNQKALNISPEDITITGGKKFRGKGVSSNRGEASIRIGHLSYKKRSLLG